MKFERKFSFVSVLLLTLILGSFTTALAKASNDEDIRIVKINDDNFEKEIMEQEKVDVCLREEGDASFSVAGKVGEEERFLAKLSFRKR